MQPVGTLYLVATPIGNLEDISQRAINTLKQVDKVLTEDTRHSQKLLNHLNIQKPLKAYHAHNEQNQLSNIVSFLKKGENLALISDAGTPLISDPGYPLVRLCRQENIPVVPIPGPCALISALSASGLASAKFTFEGFLKNKQAARQKQFFELIKEPRTSIFYEAPHRIKDCIEDIHQVLPDRKITLAKEISKQYETFITGVAKDVLTWLNEDSARQKGEFVLLIEGNPKAVDDKKALEILPKLLNYLPIKKAAKLCAELINIDAKKAYSLALELKKPASED